jgi:hypothetical protein
MHAQRAITMKTDALSNPTVKAAIESLQKGDRRAWSALFENDATLYDDGSPRSLEKFTKDALGHERFTSIDSVENNGLDLIGGFHSEPLVRGGPISDGPLAKGGFYRPCLLEVTDNSMDIVQEETFGPVMSLQVFDTKAEAVRLANDNQYGLVLLRP